MIWLASILIGCTVDRGACDLDARPQSIDDAVDAIGQLPSPVTLECFLMALERPLGLELTSDVFSAQPAQGVRSPRIFVRTDTLNMSVVPVGIGRDLLELGEPHASGLTVKAELEFPITLPLAPGAAFERVMAFPGSETTGCQVCHFEEIEASAGRFASTPLRPPVSKVVPLSVLHSEHARCDTSEDEVRCGMFSALLDHGDVYHAPFPDSFLTMTGMGG